jgi:hypothetical protein
VPTSAAYDSPKALCLAAILRVAEGMGVLVDDIVVASVGRRGLVVVLVRGSCFGVVWWLRLVVVVEERVSVDWIGAAVRIVRERA